MWLLLALTIGAAAAIAQTIQIELKGAGKNTAVFALDDAKRPHEAAPRHPGGQGPDSVAKHEIENLWTCPATDAGAPVGPRLFVLSSDNAGTYLEPSAICAEIAKQKKITIALAPATRVKLFVWLKSPELREMIADEIANAGWLFRRNLAGVVFDPPEFVEGVSVVETKGKDEDGDTVTMYRMQRNGKEVLFPEGEAGCAPLHARGSDFLMPGGINIFVGFGATGSHTCDDNTQSQGGKLSVLKDLIFIQDNPVLGVTSHELTHAFGVSASDDDPDRTYSNGHVPPDPAGANKRGDGARIFEPNNTMWPQSWVLHDRLTLAQVFWMNFSGVNSFLAQMRERSQSAAPSLRCAADCPRYATDYPRDDPRMEFTAAPNAKIVGFDKAAARSVSSSIAKRPCGGELNQDCPASAVDFVHGVVGRLEAATGLSKGATFDLHFKLASQLPDNSPRYCTKEELIDSLTKRFAEVCTAANLCGHQMEEQFVDFWKNANVTAGLIEATSSMALHAEADRSAGDPNWKASLAYREKCYRTAKDIIDAKQDRLKNVAGKRILWMDTPGANRFEEDLFRAFGIGIDCSSDPDQAIRQLQGAGLRKFWFLRRSSAYSAVITNFGADARGLKLIQEIKRRGIKVPAILYSRGVAAENAAPARKQGALGETQDPVELATLVFAALETSRSH